MGRNQPASSNQYTPWEQTRHMRLLDKGCRLEAMIPNDTFPEKMAEFCVGVARRHYLDFRVMPSSLALEGYEWQLKGQYHFVYAVWSKRHPSFGRKTVRIFQPDAVHQSTGEERTIPL